MNTYIGTKTVNATPMSRLAYNLFRGWQLPADENGNDEGYLVEYIDGGKANTTQYKGYVSWSPKDVFERAYQPVDGLPFSAALDALKKGSRVARSGWNGKNMFVYLNPGSLPASEDHAQSYYGVSVGLFETGDTETTIRMPNINMMNADGAIVSGWLASQTDMLASDWNVLD